MNVLIAGVPKKISSGVRTHTHSLRSGLEENGVETSYLSSYPQRMDKLLTSVPYRLLNMADKNAAFNWKFKSLNQYVYKKKINKTFNNFQVINIQSVDWFYSINSLLENKDVGIVLTIHGAYADQLKAKGYNEKTIERVLNLEREAFRSVKALVAVSPKTAEYVTEISGRNDVQIIPNGIITDTQKLEKNVDYTEKIKCVFVGSLIKYKGVHIAIEAISKANSRGIDVSLDIIGDGPERKALYSLAKELGIENKINFLGMLPQQDVRKKLSYYHISLIPSIPYGEKGEESFPYSCLESMYSGLITIASNVGGLSKIVSNGHDGFLVEHSKPGEISEIIERYYKFPEKFIQVKKHARENISSNYSASAMAERYLYVYESLLK
ncbi:glycosyltransferase family 4 protein [Alkalihalobacillus hwajinpoensis]|uniref:glycosyltransferase family 4 protein n=1 Tax=Guptibacillus hwajinpoensis TaxID=208199 RepID=UPI0018843D78|nr:glycosyltransferase family 4 protein [Pseudalkalibacillus hwajinpoensis]MBF0705388.1 glycosyltransferase family 4 protein [Pseudalkalibacillus hwajinpoensis]